jgi:2OG-Fe(II) oxygenase superfamily
VVESIFPYERWNARLPELARQFRAGDPFPHVVLDDFLVAEPLARTARTFPSLQDPGWIHYTHFNEQKFGKSDRLVIPAELAAVIDELNSPRFVAFLERLAGIPALLADHGLMGGGLHQSAAGGYLNVHADFTGHPHRPSWRRRLNLLLYLNDGWRDSYGGFLELWDAAMQRCVQRIAPIFNRAVIFRTGPDSFHGHPDPITCPPDVTRKSLALYYFTAETEPFLVRSTEYRARPGEGVKAVGIYLDKMAVRTFDAMKRRLGLTDYFGSAALKRLWRRRAR